VPSAHRLAPQLGVGRATQATRRNSAAKRAAKPLPRLVFAESKAFSISKLQERTLLAVDFIYVCIWVAI